MSKYWSIKLLKLLKVKSIHIMKYNANIFICNWTDLKVSISVTYNYDLKPYNILPFVTLLFHNQFLKRKKIKRHCGRMHTWIQPVSRSYLGITPPPLHELHYHHQVRNRTRMHAEPTDHNMTCLMTRDKKHSLTKWPWTPVLISFQECLSPHCDCESESNKAALLKKRQLLF